MSNNAVSSSPRTSVAQPTPHELLLSLKNEDEGDRFSRQHAASAHTADDLPGLLLSLKNTENASDASPLDGMGASLSEVKWAAVGHGEYRNLPGSPMATPPFPLPGFGNRPLTGTPKSPGSGDLPVRCSCRKSSCLKLYCFCNSQGAFCDAW